MIRASVCANGHPIDLCPRSCAAPVHESLAPLRVQWRAEHRILSREKWRIERRLAEVEEMLAAFFPEKADG